MFDDVKVPSKTNQRQLSPGERFEFQFTGNNPRMPRRVIRYESTTPL